MEFLARIQISLKPGYADPEGQTCLNSLRSLGFPVDQVRVSKLYHITLRADSLERAHDICHQICRRLLANPVKDDYSISLELIQI